MGGEAVTMKSKYLSKSDIQTIVNWIVNLEHVKLRRKIKRETITKAKLALRLPYKMIGAGSFRIVFDLGNGYVVKVALSKMGIACNETEYQIYRDYPKRVRKHLCPVLELGYGWLIMKKAKCKLKRKRSYHLQLVKLEKTFLNHGIIPNDLRKRSVEKLMKGNIALTKDDKMIIVDYGNFETINKQ